MKTKTARKGTQPASKNEAPKEINASPATLQSLGFETGEHVAKLKEPKLREIGKFLHKHGLIDDPSEWWYSDKKFAFRCGGRDYILHAEAFNVVASAWNVRLIRGQNEQERRSATREENNRAKLAACSKDSGIPENELRELCLAAGLEQFTTNGITVRDKDLVSLMVPRWMRDRLHETAVAAEIEGGINQLVEVEFGGQLSDSCDFFHDCILDGWVWKRGEKERATKALASLRKKWKLEARKGGLTK